jgi:xylan 1,4-beta-xylosidase
VTFDVYGVGPFQAQAHHGVPLEIKTTRAEVRRVDATHGDTLDAWRRIGSPAWPTEDQIDLLRKASELGPPEEVPIRNHRLTLILPPMGLAVIEIK